MGFEIGDEGEESGAELHSIPDEVDELDDADDVEDDDDDEDCAWSLSIASIVTTDVTVAVAVVVVVDPPGPFAVAVAVTVAVANNFCSSSGISTEWPLMCASISFFDLNVFSHIVHL